MAALVLNLSGRLYSLTAVGVLEECRDVAMWPHSPPSSSTTTAGVVITRPGHHRHAARTIPVSNWHSSKWRLQAANVVASVATVAQKHGYRHGRAATHLAGGVRCNAILRRDKVGDMAGAAQLHAHPLGCTISTLQVKGSIQHATDTKHCPGSLDV